MAPSIKSKRELRRMSQSELQDYCTTILNTWDRSEALQQCMEYGQQLMLANQERARNTPAPSPRTVQPGYIYILESKHGCKIGKTTNLPSRMRLLGIQLPFQATLRHTITTNDILLAENYLHQLFAHCRLNGEWFNLALEDLAWLDGIATLQF